MATPRTCSNPVTHRPVPHQVDVHHVVPKSWGGSDVKENKREVCPNCHTSVHHLLDVWVRTGAGDSPGVPVGYSRAVAVLAKRAWASRPPQPTYTTRVSIDRAAEPPPPPHPRRPDPRAHKGWKPPRSRSADDPADGAVGRP